MKLFNVLMLLGLASFVTVTSLAADRKEKEAETVAKITDIKIEILKSNPPKLEVTATGEVPRTGYKAELIRVVYVTPPADGIQDCTLKAKGPEIGATVISLVSATDTYENFPSWIKGVRVKGSGAGVVKMLDEKKK